MQMETALRILTISKMQCLVLRITCEKVEPPNGNIEKAIFNYNR